MIKVAIAGAASKIAGDIIRLLINHTDARIVCLYEPSLAGNHPVDRHYGLVGETLPEFTSDIDLSTVDVVFLCDDNGDYQDIMDNAKSDLRIIDCRHYSEVTEDFPYGLSEVNRKGLVRGATCAVLPSPQAVPSLIGLYPLAVNLLIREGVSLTISQPEGFTPNSSGDMRKEIESFLSKVQTSFATPIDISVEHRADDVRPWIESQIVLPCTLSEGDARRIFEEIYDDHNFTFILDKEPDREEVLGTQKSLISLSHETPDALTVRVLVDGSMRGRAGDAVHIMNLLFALHEQTGLRLKAVSPDYVDKR